MEDEHAEVTRDDGVGRFTLEADGAVAELVFERTADRLVLIHTEVPPPMSGKGIGGQLVEEALAMAADEGLTIVPRCPFARDWLERHPAAAAAVKVERPGSS